MKLNLPKSKVLNNYIISNECIDNLIGDFINEKCPKCGATLLGNKNGDKWCSFVGGKGIPACDYGC